jgi:hypothetical protein
MKISAFLSIVFLLIISCNKNKVNETHTVSKVYNDSVYGPMVADTIIYDVIIHNTNPEDLWAQQCLQYMNQTMLIDSLFSLVYDNKIVAYDFFENKALSIKDVKKLEEESGFKRENIGKIQFTERWYFSPAEKRFRKDVISIVLGYDLFNEEGSVRGHKPVFKLFLNQ